MADRLLGRTTVGCRTGILMLLRGFILGFLRGWGCHLGQLVGCELSRGCVDKGVRVLTVHHHIIAPPQGNLQTLAQRHESCWSAPGGWWAVLRLSAFRRGCTAAVEAPARHHPSENPCLSLRSNLHSICIYRDSLEPAQDEVSAGLQGWYCSHVRCVHKSWL